MIAILCLFLFAGIAEARVDFKNSRVYDEFDFKGQSTVSIDDLCSGVCDIYASITPESKKLAANLLIQLPTGFISIADVAARIDPTSNEKLPLIVNKTASLKIVNANGQLAAGPLVLYIVGKQYAINPPYDIYEAEGLDLPVAAFPLTITVMSARPFTLQQATREGNPQVSPQGIMATMSGYDGMCMDSHSDCSCWSLFFRSSGTHFNGLMMEVNGPIVSMSYDNFNFGLPLPHLIGTIGITNKLELDKADFVGSPGAHGCDGKQPYRSSLYDMTSPILAEITSDSAATFNVEVGTNTNALTLTDDSGKSTSVPIMVGHQPKRFSFNTKNLMVDWTPNGTGKDFFLVQWNGTIPSGTLP